jgi:hypothetical protein
VGEKEFQPRVVRRVGLWRKREVVCQDSIRVVSASGKSEPWSIIQDIFWERGGGENIRAPRAEYVPAPPIISNKGGFGGW